VKQFKKRYRDGEKMAGECEEHERKGDRGVCVAEGLER
jgi:hypothetical protein